jgi:acetyltransferase-like isoleucine patch superfamily enzyme
MSSIILIGAGALGRDLIEAFGAAAFAGVYVDPGHAAADMRGLPLLSSWEEVCARATHYVLGVADIAHRERARAAARRAGLSPAAPMVARTAVVAEDAILAPGVAIGQMAVVGPAAQLGEDTLVMHACVVAHDVVLESNCVLCAGVSLGGRVRLEAQVFVGSNAVLAPDVSMGQGSYVAAGAACFRDGPAASRWLGNPARRTDVHLSVVEAA